MKAFASSVPRFTRNLWLLLAVFIVFAATFIFYVASEKQIDRANEARQRSFLLADELRQSSDDLTRMVRTYIVTGDRLYKQHYQEILDIRDGRRPRPLDYHNVYWDLVAGNDQRPRPSGQAVPLLDMMRQAGFTPDEFATLAEAKANSDALTRTEFAAMQRIESGQGLPQENRDAAIRMLHDVAYHQAKAAIMQPISEFFRLADRRTLAAVRKAETNAEWMRLVFILFGSLLIYMLWGVRRNLNAILGGPLKLLHARIARLGSGDFSSPIPVAPGLEGSILGRLSETQANLARIDVRRKEAEARTRRLTQLYVGLSQCNQTIVRCADEAQLFVQICDVVVTIGGIRMAWIGMLDEQGTHIEAVARAGEGSGDMDNFRIAIDPDDPRGSGPTARVFRENAPFWCQDFLLDTANATWQDPGLRFGGGAAAALPLHRNGQVIGVFSIYADVSNVFDEEVRSLLLEMTTDIDYALKGFEQARQRAQAERALRASEQRLRTIIETEPECIKVLDAQGRLLEMNAAGLTMLEADSLEQARQQPLQSYLLPEYRAGFKALHDSVMRGESGKLEFQITGLKGTQRWLETHAAPMPDASGEVVMLLGVTRDITERKRSEARIQYLAHFDALTGLPNRAQLDDRARYAISLAQRAGEPVALMFLDIDHFKDINDTLGHSIGDAMLVEIAGRLGSVLREQDTVSRLGGDEFIFLLYGVDPAGAAQVAQKLLDVIAGRFRIDGHDLNVTGSIGIAMYPDDGADLETLFKNADTAMYCVKQEGRHGYRFFTAQMQIRSARHLQLVTALREALDLNQLEVHYQPQVSMRHGRIIGAEALLRWTHPELGQVSPVEFIPAAEDSGLILPIGEWVLRQAVRQARQWLQDGLAPIVMAVNLSVIQFRHADLPELVSRILEEEGLAPEYLELELTESLAMNDPQGAIAVMNNLHARGVRMSIDDFGTGFSSLSHLKKFRIYKLKIDKSFVRDISTDPEDKAIVGAIIHMAQSLGLLTIAEGVETASQLAFLREQGCDEMQGYYCSKPLPASQFEAFARTGLLNPEMGGARQVS